MKLAPSLTSANILVIGVYSASFPATAAAVARLKSFVIFAAACVPLAAVTRLRMAMFFFAAAFSSSVSLLRIGAYDEKMIILVQKD
jgi:hypothetical protein